MPWKRDEPWKRDGPWKRAVPWKRDAPWKRDVLMKEPYSHDVPANKQNTHAVVRACEQQVSGRAGAQACRRASMRVCECASDSIAVSKHPV